MLGHTALQRYRKADFHYKSQVYLHLEIDATEKRLYREMEETGERGGRIPDCLFHKQQICKIPNYIEKD